MLCIKCILLKPISLECVLFFGEKELCVFRQGFGLAFFVFIEKICSFFGHRDVFCDLKNELITEIEKAINKHGITTFYVGDRGDFDRIAASSIMSIKHKYPNIKLVLVLPYFTNKLNKYKELYEQDYDEIFIPQELMGAHPKGAITKRNRLMVDQSDLIICYINREFGGAYNTVKYSKRKNKTIIYVK